MKTTINNKKESNAKFVNHYFKKCGGRVLKNVFIIFILNKYLIKIGFIL